VTDLDVLSGRRRKERGPRGGDLGTRINAVFSTMAGASPDELAWAGGPLVERIARDPRLSLLGILGEMLCRRLSFWGAVPQELAGIRHHLDDAAAVERAVLPLIPPDQKIRDLPSDQWHELLDRLPEPIRGQGRGLELLGNILGPASRGARRELRPMAGGSRARALAGGLVGRKRL
jgi:hypothetical protein